LVVCKRYTSFFNVGFGKFCFKADIYHPILPVVLETELDSMMKIHNTRGKDPGDLFEPSGSFILRSFL
jgi:hypothetical protein